MSVSSLSEMNKSWRTPYFLQIALSRTLRALFVLTVAIALLSIGAFYHAPKSPTRAALSSSTTPISHIVFMIKENRSFDNMFGTFPGANGATTFTDPKGNVHPLNHQPDHLQSDIDHSHVGYLKAYDNVKMDKFSTIVE